MEGPLYRTRGSAFDVAYDASAFALDPAGTLRVEFAADGSATATLRLGGQTLVKPLQRQPI